MTNIPHDLFVEIHKNMPIICVDVVVSDGKSVLLVKRDREPEKDQWWFPGGRLLKYESLKNAAYRIVKKETNLSLRSAYYLNLAETKFDIDPFNHNQGTHTVNMVYMGRPRETSIFNVALDDNHSEHLWVSFEDIYNISYHPYIKRFVALAEGNLKL